MLTETEFLRLRAEFEEMINSVPEDQRWAVLLSFLQKLKGWKYLFIYGGETLERPKLAYDRKNGGIGYVLPDKVIVLQRVKIGYLTEERKLTEIDFRANADPSPSETLLLLRLFGYL